MFKFSKLTVATTITFVVALLCVMLNNVWVYFIFPALFLIGAGFVLLTVKLSLGLKQKNSEQELVREELIMELSVSEQGEEYVIKNSSQSKKFRRRQRMEKFNNLLPILVCGTIAGAILFLFLRAIFKF